MRDIVSTVYGVTSEVVYPPSITDAPQPEPPDWEERIMRFVSIGRIAPDKDLLALVEYFHVLQTKFPTAEFVLAGRSHDASYERLLIEKARIRDVRLRIVKGLTDPELSRLLRESKFYIHAKINEHFGISVVDAVAAGCIVMVHDSGGPKEIVGRPELRFKTPFDLLQKVVRLNEDASMRLDVRSSLRASLERFTFASFYARLDEVLGPLMESMNLAN